MAGDGAIRVAGLRKSFDETVVLDEPVLLAPRAATSQHAGTRVRHR